MADKVRYLIADKGVLDSATLVVSLVASTQTAGLPPRNVQDEHIRKVYRTTNKKRNYLRYRFAAATTMTCLFLGRHNFTKNATLYWQGNTTSNFNSPALSYRLLAVTDARGNVIPKLAYFWSTTPTAYAHWRLLFADGTNSTSNLELGRIMGGRYDEPSKDIRDGFSVETVDPSRTVQTAGRMGYPNVRPTYERLTYTVGNMDAALHDTFYGIYNEVGIRQPFVLALDPISRPTHHTYYGQFTESFKRRHTVISQYDLESLVYEEKV